MTRPISASGGRDRFRCGDKADPQYRGVTIYHDIVANVRIVSSETIEAAGQRLLISMATTTLAPEGAGTKVTVTVQLVSLVGERTIDGARFGHSAALHNLVAALR